MSKSTRERDILRSLGDCSRAIQDTADVKLTMQTVYACCNKIIGAAAGYIALNSPKESRLEIVFADMDEITTALELTAPASGIFELIDSGREGLFENSFQQCEWRHYFPEGHDNIANILLIPIAMNNKTAGLLCYADKPGGFCEDDILVAGTFAQLTSLGLQNRTGQHDQTNASRDLNLSNLRKSAEAGLRNQAGRLDELSRQGMKQIVHELGTYQIELEMQNENLRQVLLELEESRRRYTDLYNYAPVGYFTFDLDGMVILANLTGASMLGTTRRQLLKKPFTVFVHEDDRELFYQCIRDTMRQHSNQFCEMRFQKKDGAVMHVHLESRPVRDDTGTVVAILTTATDISVHKRLEQQLQMEENRLREVFSHMRGGGAIYKAIDDGEDFIIVDFHRPELMEFHGKGEDLRGRRILDVFPACRDHGLLEVFQRVLKTGRAELYPLHIFDGKRITVWRENYVFKLSTGEIVALYDDLTEKKKMETALQESESLFRTVFETSPDAININRLRDGQYIKVSDSFLELSGFKKSEVIGKTAFEIDVWCDLDKRKHFFAELFQEGHVKDFEADFKCKDGTILSTLVSAGIITYQREPHLLAVVQNITELKKTEQALRDAHKQLKKKFEIRSEQLKESRIIYYTLVEALLTGVYMHKDAKIVFVNKEFADIFSYDKEELLRMNLYDLIHPDDRDYFITLQDNISGVENTESDFEVRGINKQGNIIHLLGRSRTIVDHQGLQVILGNVANISKRKRAEENMRKTKEELHTLSARLLSTEEKERKRIAHDIHDSIGGALSAIKFSVENALRNIPEKKLPQAAEALQNIIPLTQQSIEEVRRIIMDLRPSILDDLGLIATISWLCREFKSVFADIHIEREIDVEEDDIPPPLKTVIYRILQEALNNAAIHSGTKFIRIHLLKKTGNLELLVQDTGHGFDINKNKDAGRGEYGIGLTSMKERTQLSGGVFTIRTSPGKGTRIHFTWPLEKTGDDQRPVKIQHQQEKN